MDLYRGELIGKYEVITQLSVGGMAELFLGFTSGPGGFRKYVAIKRILPDVRSNEQFERMFLDEARITAAFNHPNIAQVYELGQEDDGLFLAMEFVAGQNLDQLTDACRRRRQPLPLGMSLAVGRDVCMALHYAHTFAGPSGRPSPVIHRDVAQKNIMVTYDGVVKLLDFGIAKARGSLERTHVGTVKGTAGYMSPEQVRGDPIDGRSDLFSLGVVLWELVTGQRLFEGKTERDEMVNILEAPIPSPRQRAGQVSEEVSAVILKALERNAGDRWQSGRDMARALEDAAGRMMFDTDRRAALMRSLFQSKMASTRALLDSADVGKAPAPSGPEPAVIVSPDVGEPESWEPSTPLPRAEDEELAAEAASLSARATALPEDDSVTRDATRGPWAIILLALVVGGGFLIWKLVPALDEQVEPEPKVPAFVDPRLRQFPESGQPIPPPVQAADAGSAAVAEPVEQTGKKEETPGKKETGKPSKRGAPVQTGLLTLVITPEASVFLDNELLGRTPIFNKAMRTGTHYLLVLGPDGQKRRLSVPIKAGKPVVLKLSLNEIPLR
ncbi:serine/threonine-protein kinase [Stigmatella sp. ncwal1]|uniref:Serine/threonine-protein kinase n=1 Tax=Stigmatella ashevillensis TaxID=2995309 RepID=A0ABT5DEB1_9BACT|nr:serine/threonine-protein kinase [Stigmatella ashevillena]MDC0711919.1 serine/threonine-protein kinase [Stigmatella ashevillena]